MKLLKKKSFLIFYSLLLFACNDPDIIGADLYPGSDKITINNESVEHFTIHTISEDNVQSDESLFLLLGQISNDPVFGENKGSFATQILLPSNNIQKIIYESVDSVLLIYSYSDSAGRGYYGDELNQDFIVSVYKLDDGILEEDAYYSNFTPNYDPDNLATGQNFSTDGSFGLLKIRLDNALGQTLMDETGNPSMQDNDSFLEFFKGIFVEATANNTIMYLNPTSSQSKFSIFYHKDGEDSARSLDFELGDNTARINIFNKKDSSNFPNQSYSSQETYIQSMAGHKGKIIFDNISTLQEIFANKIVNKVTMDFEIINSGYDPHNRLVLVRENNSGEIVKLIDQEIDGDDHFGGFIENEDNYSFNITRYFFELLNNDEYTNKLYLRPDFPAENANRTILDNSKISINVIYSEL